MVFELTVCSAVPELAKSCTANTLPLGISELSKEYAADGNDVTEDTDWLFNVVNAIARYPAISMRVMLDPPP